MITYLVGKLIGWGVPKEVAKPLLLVLVVGGLMLGLGVAKCVYDNRVIAQHEARQDAANAKADRKADNNAAEQRTVDQDRAVQERRQLEEVNAKVADPAERRVARLRCIELQRQARAANRKPPACL